MGAPSNGAITARGITVGNAPGHRTGRAAHRISWRHSHRSTDRAHEPSIARHVAAERQRIAGRLHDEVSSLLFAVAAGVQRAQVVAGADVDELRATLARVGEQVLAASDRMRDVLRDCTPEAPGDGVPAAVQRDLDDLNERSGVQAHLVIRGPVRSIPGAVERVALNCLRQALFNIERHASAGTVVVAVQYLPEELVLVVQDDGCGLPPGYEPRVVPADGHHWGFASMARQVQQRGGEVELSGSDDGGARLRVRLPA
ncbi:MAG: sensor histidine kinase [Pseudonocardia sp.]